MSKTLAQKLAAEITGSREAFALAFEGAQAGLNPTERTDFKVVGTSANDATAFEQAFAFAQVHGFLSDLLFGAAGAALAPPRLLKIAMGADAAPAPPPQTPGAAPRRRSALESLSDPGRGWLNPLIESAEYSRVLRQVCEVIVDNVTNGTGVLIGPNLVLTAWHVVAPAFSRGQGETKWQVIKGAETRIQVGFDRLMDGGQLAPSLAPCRYPVASKWLVDWSPCHDSEKDDGDLPDESVDLKDFLDFAVLRLGESVGVLRRWRKLSDVVPPLKDMDISVYQYPQAFPLLKDEGKVAEVLPRPRFLHLTNTDHASSGGPCFDRKLHLVGLHHAGFVRDAALPVKERRNRGIPAPAIVARIGALPEADPASHLVWRMNDAQPGPVIGLREFQALIFESAGLRPLQGAIPRIIRVSGGPQSGKTFCVRLFRQLLGSTEDVVLAWSANQLPPKAEDLVLGVLKACRFREDQLPRPLPTIKEAKTTEVAWLRNKLVPAFGDLLQTAAAGRRVWLAIDELDQHALPEGTTQEFLGLLYEQISSMDGLRILLCGMKGPLPQRATTHTREFRLQEPTQVEVLDYLAQHYLAGNSLDNPAPIATAIVAAARSVVGANPQGASLITMIEKLITQDMATALPPLPADAGGIT